MRGQIKGMGAKQTYWIDGRQVSKRAFKRAFPDKSLAGGQDCITAWKKPVLSDGLAVHPRQIPAAIERNRRHGVHVDYHSDGRPILRQRGERRALLRIEKAHDNDGGYGD